MFPENATLWGLGPHYVEFGDARENRKQYKINLFGGEYDIFVERVLYLYHSIELYRWCNNYEIQNLFDRAYPDVYDEHHKKYEMVCGGFYPTDALLDEMKKIDDEFSKKYCRAIPNVFYSADW